MLWYAKQVNEQLQIGMNQAFFIGKSRTLTQDIEYAMRQVVEVAVRALSPGINDPFTAMSCIDWLGQALCHIEARGLPSPYYYDKSGKLRVITKPITYQFITNAAFDQIREAARSTALVTIHLLETIAIVATETTDKELHAELLRHAKCIENDSQKALSDDTDQQRVHALARQFILGE